MIQQIEVSGGIQCIFRIRKIAATAAGANGA